jgi:phosphatidylinositol alpha 1,6-mannosyltransferase
VSAAPRVVLFSDSYHGVDGVATTCRNITEAARQRDWPLLAIHVGPRKRRWREGSTEFLELDRGPLSFEVDRHLRFDLFFLRHFKYTLEAVQEFRPDVVHVTGPGDVGITGTQVAALLRLPLIAAWHTSLHRFAARRLEPFVAPLPDVPRRLILKLTEAFVLRACMRFYEIAQVVLAPNVEDMELLGKYTGKPVFPMRRGVNLRQFSPTKRTVQDNIFRFGYVGRLCPEKNVRLLVELERALLSEGIDRYRFLIVGDGGERPWLERKLQRADFTGELHGEFLAEAYANMDLFVFPSETDTFGNVVLESLASATPVLVTSKGGPKYLVQNGITGFVAADSKDFIAKAKLVFSSPKLHRSLREAAHRGAQNRSWANVLDDLSDAYRAGISHPGVARPVAALAEGRVS